MRLRNGRTKALNLNTLKTPAFEYINNITINQVICDFPSFFYWRSFIEIAVLEISSHDKGEQIECRVIWLISSSTSHFSHMSHLTSFVCINDLFLLASWSRFTHARGWLATNSISSINICTHYKSPLSGYVSFTSNKLCQQWAQSREWCASLNELQKNQLIKLFWIHLMKWNFLFGKLRNFKACFVIFPPITNSSHLS